MTRSGVHIEPRGQEAIVISPDHELEHAIERELDWASDVTGDPAEYAAWCMKTRGDPTTPLLR